MSQLPSEIAATLDFNPLYDAVATIDPALLQLLPTMNPAEWEVSGLIWDWKAFGEYFWNFCSVELLSNAHILGQVLLLGLLLALVQNLKHSFAGDTVGQTADAVGLLLVVALVFGGFKDVLQLVTLIIDQAAHFVSALLPLFFSVLVAGGGLVTATILHPLLISAVAVMVWLLKSIVYPLLLYSGLVGLFGHFFEGFSLNKLAKLLKNIALGILGAGMTIFIALVTLRGLSGNVADSMALRTAKVSVGLLPVVGRIMADTVELTAGCSAVLRNGIGILGLGILALIIIFPMLKILFLGFVYCLGAALLQPLNHERLSDILQAVGETFIGFFGATAISGLMFFVTIAVLLGILRLGM